MVSYIFHYSRNNSSCFSVFIHYAGYILNIYIYMYTYRQFLLLLYSTLVRACHWNADRIGKINALLWHPLVPLRKRILLVCAPSKKSNKESTESGPKDSGPERLNRGKIASKSSNRPLRQQTHRWYWDQTLLGRSAPVTDWVTDWSVVLGPKCKTGHKQGEKGRGSFAIGGQSAGNMAIWKLFFHLLLVVLDL